MHAFWFCEVFFSQLTIGVSIHYFNTRTNPFFRTVKLATYRFFVITYLGISDALINLIV